MPILNLAKLKNLIKIISCFVFINVANINSGYSTQIYLEDGDPRTPTNNPNMPSIADHLWPRVMMAETQSLTGNIERYSKYQVIATAAGVIKKVADLQQLYPNLMYFRMFNPYEYSGFNFEDQNSDYVCSQGNGIPFNETTSSTGGCGVFAGHWLYQAGTKTSSFINPTATTLPVDDASLFTVGQYAVIYDAPAGSFNNAEHVRITSRNLSNKTINIQRAYKSAARNHPNRSIIAQHALGQNSNNDARNWLYNLSINGPKDASNRRLINYLPFWLQSNYKRNFLNELTNADVSGFLFDSDGVILSPSKNADSNNDLVIDHGFSEFGVNWHGLGLDRFYADLRSLFPNLIIVGGVRDSAGYSSLNGVQMEGFPNHINFHTTSPDYSRLNSLLARYRYQSRYRDTGPSHSHILSKTPSGIYPVSGSPTSNKPFRFAFGMTLLEDGYFANLNSQTYPDIWYDEYAVDVKPGSSTFGQAIVSNPNNESNIRQHTGWLGRPNGVRQRIYKDSDFAVSKSLLQNGTFENGSDLNAWTGTEVNISRTNNSVHVQDGTFALHASEQLNYQELLFEASIKGPNVSVIAGRDYTFVFSAKASEQREISASIGGHTERYLLGPEWQRFVVSFTAQTSGSFPAKFNVGKENTEFWLDTVHLFEGNANIFRRDFTNGIVIVNATPVSRTIDLEGTFQRIKGNQLSINDGSKLSSITLFPYDSAILIRTEETETMGAILGGVIYLLLSKED